MLAAPTGKAAKRLEQVVGHEASTIHRLLGFNGNTYSRDALTTRSKPTSWSSMRSRWWTCRLPGGCSRPSICTRTAVVLGRRSQPVAAGGPGQSPARSRAVQRDPDDRAHQIIRQAGVLKENSTAILDGEVRPTVRRARSARAGHGTSSTSSPTASDVRRMLLLLFEEVLTGAPRLRPDPRRSGADADPQGPARHGGAEHRAPATLAEEAVRRRRARGRSRAPARGSTQATR